MPVRILTIDGGGIRGVLPATVLRELERRTGRPTHELFDLIVGTSTGALLTLGLTAPDPVGGARYRADDLRSLYLDEGPRIFSRPWLHRIRSANGVTNAKYPASGLEEVVGRYFGTTRLSESLGNVLVTAYETEQREPFLFRNRRARAAPGYDFALEDVARAVTAAPTYFPAARISAGDGRAWSLIDGGVYANNPAMVAVVEALAEDPDGLFTVSLGTGDLSRPLPHRQIRSWGLLAWARPLIDIVVDGVTSTVDFQARQLARSAGDEGGHVRLDVPLTIGSDDLDDTSATNLAALVSLADAMVRDRAADLDRIASTLVADG